MPDLIEGSQSSGQLRAELSSRWGMTENPVVAGGGGDNAASACGVGVVAPGTGFVSLGTSGVLFVSNAQFAPNTDGAVHAFCHALPNIWHQMGVILSATDSLNWLARTTQNSAAELAKSVDATGAGPSGSLFLPYLSGERTPHNDAGARGAFIGLSHLSDPAALAHAVMDGVVYAFKDSQRVLQDGGATINSLLAVGGGARSSYWLQTLATVLNVPIVIPKDGDFGAAFGAARLGLCAAEDVDPFEICVAPAIAGEILPDANLAAAYMEQYQQYRSLYPAIKSALGG
jgi:xylulokinase